VSDQPRRTPAKLHLHRHVQRRRPEVTELDRDLEGRDAVAGVGTEMELRRVLLLRRMKKRMDRSDRVE